MNNERKVAITASLLAVGLIALNITKTPDVVLYCTNLAASGLICIAAIFFILGRERNIGSQNNN